MNTQQLREAFLVTDLFQPGRICGTFTDLDRLAVGGAMPLRPIELSNHKETGQSFFLERRELGVINVGGQGILRVDGKTFELGKLDCVYVPIHTRKVVFESADSHHAAQFFWLSCPAHAELPAAILKHKDITPTQVGSLASASKAQVYKCIHPGGLPSCQLQMGVTELCEGSVWNTFPPHIHHRRSQINFYFDLHDRIVMHLMGEPHQTRHLMMHDHHAVLVPSWSMHAGCGSGTYRFIWGMAGENQSFDEVDSIRPSELR